MNPKGVKPREGRSDPDGRPSARNFAIYARWCEGTKTLKAIGAEFGISGMRVCAIRKAVGEYCVKQVYPDRIASIKQEHTDRLEAMIRHAMSGWVRSQQNAETVENIVILSDDGAEYLIPIKRKVTGQAGDPKFLDVAMKGLEQIRKIWGAEAPITIEALEPRAAGQAPAEVVAKIRGQLLAALGASGN